MKTNKLNKTEISQYKVASLPNRPNAPYAFGGSGLTAGELKSAFDALPLLIAERLNSLIDDISGANGGSITDAVKTGISEDHTLEDLIKDVTSGAFITYLAGPSGSVAEYLLALRRDVDKIASAVGVSIKEEQ